MALAEEQAEEHADDSPREDLIDEARQVLLSDVREQVPDKVSVGAALMGVTPPTYKRWLQAGEGNHG